MDICSEHGYESIAFSTARNNGCPACAQIEELQGEYDDRAAELLNSLEDANSRIDELEDELSDLRSEAN